MKRPYETMFLLSPTINEGDLDAFIEKTKEMIQKKAGEVTEVQRMGVRKTAYDINKSRSATYVLIKYSGTGDTVKELERQFKNADEVWKYLTTLVSSRPTFAPKSKYKIRREEKKAAARAAAAKVEAKNAAAAVSSDAAQPKE